MKTEKEYQECKSRLAADLKEIESHAEKMRASGLTEEQIKFALDPLISFACQLQEEIEEYERLKRGL